MSKKGKQHQLSLGAGGPVLGLDEAGRGCIIGPMVVGGVGIHGGPKAVGAVEEELVSMGVRDSKTLSPEERFDLAEGIREYGQATGKLVWYVREVSARAINLGNLNELELDVFAQIYRELSPRKVVLDLPVHPGGAERFKQQFLSRLELDGTLPSPLPELVFENKADARFPVVAAASILAKTHRDRFIEKLHSLLGDFGSGYPADHRTRQFLKDNWTTGELDPLLVEHVRSRWATMDVLGLRQGILPFM